ncbi:MAG: penicillin-binding protein 2 [Planctomycetota bacterium]|nr:MAG: penicillin-binding protein 2 [Planctomycetota bacterium]
MNSAGEISSSYYRSTGDYLRATGFAVLLLGLFLGLIWRLYSIQIIEYSHYLGKARHQHTQSIHVPAPRGPIVANDGTVLAIDVVRRSVCADPGLVEENKRSAMLETLRQVLNLSDAEFAQVRPRFLRRGNKYVALKSDATAEEALAIRQLDHRAFFTESEFTRVYPNGVFASALIGFAGPDRGRDGRPVRSGIELACDKHLEGVAGAKEYFCDARRRAISLPGLKDVPAVPGAAVVLTLDVVVQKIVEEELDALNEEFKPETAVAIMLDAKTGKVLAMANRPTFDPNDYGRAGSKKNNVAVTCVFEPGSTFKPFIAGPALSEGVITPETPFNCHRGTWWIGRRKITDVYGYGTLSATDVIVKSSNIGATQIGLRLGKEKMRKYLARFGFGKASGVGLPGESSGLLHSPARWHHQDTISTSFGYAVAATPIQLVSAFSVFATGGVRYRPYVVERVVDRDGVVIEENRPEEACRVISAQTAKKMVKILTEVVERGTGKKAKSKKYKIAGKTGTAHIALPGGGYAPDRHNATFLSFAPAGDPKIALIVTARAPKGVHYGGLVAAPAAGRIIERVLTYYRVPPDK